MRCNKRIYKGSPGSQIDLIFVKNVFLALQPFKRVLKLKFSKISESGVIPPWENSVKNKDFSVQKNYVVFFCIFFNALSRDPCIKPVWCQNDIICHPKGDQKVLILDPSKKIQAIQNFAFFWADFYAFLGRLVQIFHEISTPKNNVTEWTFECTRKKYNVKKKYSVEKKIKKYTGDPIFAFFLSRFSIKIGVTRGPRKLQNGASKLR